METTPTAAETAADLIAKYGAKKASRIAERRAAGTSNTNKYLFWTSVAMRVARSL